MLSHHTNTITNGEQASERQVVRVNPEAPGSQPQIHAERVAMTIPARPEYVGVVRLAAAAIAGRMAFGYDDIEDLKVAVSEACSGAILGGGGQVEIQFDVKADRLEITISGAGGQSGGAAPESELGLLLMRVLMDEVRTDLEGSGQILRMTKRLPA